MSDDTEQHEPKSETDEPDRAVAQGKDASNPWAMLLAWSPDGTHLATGSTQLATGADAQIIDVSSGEVRRFELGGSICALAWSPDGSLLAVGCADGNTSIIDAGSGEVRHRLEHGRAAADETPKSGIEHGEAELQALQDHIDKVRSQTGQQRDEEEEGADEGDSEVAPPG